MSEIILIIFLGLNFIKAVIIGSDFNFYYWFKYGKHYTDWYFNKDEYKPKH
jgi:hypothetical protein